MTAAKSDKTGFFLSFFFLNLAAHEKQKQNKHNSEKSREGQTASNIGCPEAFSVPRLGSLTA